MIDKHYGLTKGYGEDNKDTVPEWMYDILDTMAKPKEKKEHPFYGVDDMILNPQRLGVKDKDKDEDKE